MFKRGLDGSNLLKSGRHGTVLAKPSTAVHYSRNAEKIDGLKTSFSQLSPPLVWSAVYTGQSAWAPRLRKKPPGGSLRVMLLSSYFLKS